MFDLDQFIEDCRRARGGDEPQKRVREILARAVANPSEVLRALGEPSRGAVQKLYHAPDLTILNITWPPYMTLMPHNHQMWAVIGMYSGREDNIFWRRCPERRERVEAVGAKALSTGETLPTGDDLIHSVTNPIPRVTAAIHVYGGDFFGVERSEWDAETLTEQRWVAERALRRFEEANRIVV